MYVFLLLGSIILLMGFVTVIGGAGGGRWWLSVMKIGVRERIEKINIYQEGEEWVGWGWIGVYFYLLNN